jgi:hypothetical protein
MQNTTVHPNSLAYAMAIGNLFRAMQNNAMVTAEGLKRTFQAPATNLTTTLTAQKVGRVLEITHQRSDHATAFKVTAEQVPVFIAALDQDNQRRESSRYFDQLAATTHRYLEQVGA